MSSQPPPSTDPLAAAIARLRAELEGAASDGARALLLHEVGILEEASNDEGGAARDLLGAVNADPDFREPLEQLIGLVERRPASRNLGKLLERLGKVAEHADERVRAAVERAALCLDHDSDPERARELLEEARAEAPDAVTLLLLLEAVAGRLGDAALRLGVVERRAELSAHPAWRALLLVELAELQQAEGDADRALETIAAAVALQGPVTWLALEAWEALARGAGRPEVAARALEAQAALAVRSAGSAASADALGVPRWCRTTTHAADRWLRASTAHREHGDLPAAAALLDRALEQIPSEPSLVHARLIAAEVSGDTQGAAAFARAELERGVRGPLAAALWLRVAEQATGAGEGPAALEAVQKALAEDPRCLPARALALDLLAGGHDPAALGSLLESTAEQLETDAAKAGTYLLAAEAWGRLGTDAPAARAALTQAGMAGASPALLTRVARLLAPYTQDTAWYEEGSRRLALSSGAGPEAASLWFELVRGKLVRGEQGGAATAAASLAQQPEGAWLGRVLAGVVAPFAPTAEGEEPTAPAPEAIGELAALESDPAVSRALRHAVAQRALAAGDAARARAELGRLQAEDPGSLVVASERATLARQAAAPLEASQALAAAGAAQADPELAAALQLEAGVEAWHAGDRAAAVQAFAQAAELSPSATALHAWALGAAAPDDPAARRAALALDRTPSAALERFFLELGQGGDAAEAGAALELAEGRAEPQLALAAALARVAWAASPEGADEAALDRLEGSGGAGPALAAAARHLADVAGQPTAVGDAEKAARWMDSTASAAAALATVLAAAAGGDAELEARARRALGTRLGGDAGEALDASGALLEALGGATPAPVLAASPVGRLANLELAPPGCDPRRRADALGALGEALGTDAPPLAACLAGYNQLAALDLEGALASFRKVIEAYPTEIIGWEGMRALAELAGERGLLAEALAGLGSSVTDEAQGAEYWERAGLIVADELQRPEQAEMAFAQAVARDVRRPVAFDRLFRSVRARRDGPRLLEIVAARLTVAEDPTEIAKLHWEQARVLRGAGDREGALAALENVTMLEPDHVGALALSGEIYITTGQFAEAAESLDRLSTLDEAPAQQRLMGGVAAADLYENKLGKPEAAVATLRGLHRAGLATLPVRERLARAAARTQSWDTAAELAELLMEERDTAEGRIEAARLALVVHRDHRGRPADALPAVRRLLTEAPGDGEALDLVLAGTFDAATTRELLEASRAVVTRELAATPTDAPRVRRLTAIAQALGIAPLRQATLGVLVALGEGSAEIDRELAQLDQRVARLPHIAVNEHALPELFDREDSGALPEMMLALATTFAEAIGPGLAAFGVGRKEKVDPRAGLPLRNEIAAWAGALAVGDFDLYVGGSDPQGITAIPLEVPAVVVGAQVGTPLAPHHRAAVARELLALKRGTTILRHRDAGDIAALVVAASRVVGVEIPSPQYAMLAEFQRVLGKEMSRAVKKVLPARAAAVAQSGQDIGRWVQAATASLDRLAAVAAGDVSWVLAQGGVRGSIGPTAEARERAQRLLGFVLSPAYLTLRDQLGMGVR